MNNQDERDEHEERYWANYCPVCDESVRSLAEHEHARGE